MDKYPYLNRIKLTEMGFQGPTYSILCDECIKKTNLFNVSKAVKLNSINQPDVTQMCAAFYERLNTTPRVAFGKICSKVIQPAEYYIHQECCGRQAHYLFLLIPMSPIDYINALENNATPS